MRNRKLRVLSLVAMGYSFQVLGCQNETVGQFLADTIKDAAIGVSSIVIEDVIDNALGIED